MQSVRFLLGLAAAAGLLTLTARIDPLLARVIDGFLLLTVYHTLLTSPAGGMVGGTVAGLAQDALSGGLFGLHGFANTVVAYAVAQLRDRLVIQQPLQLGLVFALAAAVQAAMLAMLQFLLSSPAELPGPLATVAEMAVSGVLGALLVEVATRVRAYERRWRDQRQKRLRIEAR